QPRRMFSAAGSYAPSALSLATAVASLCIVVLGASVMLRSRMFAGSLFFVVTLTSAGWLACFATMYATTDPGRALFWGRSGAFFGVLVPAAVFQFICEMIGRRRQFALPSILFWSGCAAVGLIALFTPAIAPAVHHYEWGYYVVNDATANMLAGAFAAIILPSIYLLWR